MVNPSHPAQPPPYYGFHIEKEFNVMFSSLHADAQRRCLLQGMNHKFRHYAKEAVETLVHIGSMTQPWYNPHDDSGEFTILWMHNEHQYQLFLDVVRRPHFTWRIQCTAPRTNQVINFFRYAGPDKVNPEHILDLEACVRVITKMKLQWESYFSPQLLYDYNHNDWNL
jgi:hypothetical protein